MSSSLFHDSTVNLLLCKGVIILIDVESAGVSEKKLYVLAIRVKKMSASLSLGPLLRLFRS